MSAIENVNECPLLADCALAGIPFDALHAEALGIVLRLFA